MRSFSADFFFVACCFLSHGTSQSFSIHCKVKKRAYVSMMKVTIIANLSELLPFINTKAIKEQVMDQSDAFNSSHGS